MAIYVPQIQDYIPQLQPFKPDFNFYAGALQMKQTEYDNSYKKLSSVYGTLLNSPMLRDSNISRRDQFFKDADTQIKKIAGLDLSRAENVDAAMSIFKPFYEDKALIKDMTWTKQYQNEMTRAENFRNCVDPKKCGGQYWEGGVKALNYKAQDFRNASDDEALSFSSPKFTPFINITEKATLAAKEAGFNIQVDTLKGGYIVTTKNGQLLEQPLHDYFMGLFGSDPAVVEMFKTQAYIQRKDFSYANAAKFGGIEQAEQAYVNQIMTNMVPTQSKNAANAEDLSTGLSAKKNAMDKHIAENGIIIGTPEHKAYSDLQAQIEGAETTTAVYKQATDLAQSASNLNNLSAMRDRVDDIVTYGLLNTQMDALSKSIAYRDYSVSLKEDPYAMAAYSSSLALKNAMTMKAVDFEYWKQKEAVKGQMADQQQLGSAEQNSMTPDHTAVGTSAEENALLAKDANAQKYTELKTQQSGDERLYLKQLANTLAAEYAAAPGHKTNGQDDGGTRQAMLKETAMKAFNGTGLDWRKILSGTEDLSKIDKIDPTRSSSAYQRAVSETNPNAPVTGSVNNFWNQSFWDQTANIREGVKNRSTIMSDFSKYYKEENTKVINTILAEPDVQQEKDDLGEVFTVAYAVNMLTTPEGRVKTKDQFTKEYAQKNSFYFSRETSFGFANGEPLSKQEQYNRALEQGADLYDDAYEKYNDTYLRVGKAYNAPPNMSGPAGGAVSGGAVRGTVDANNVKARNTLYAADVFKNIGQLDLSGDAGAFVKYGDADKKENSDGADAVLKQLMSDFNTQPTKGRKKPVFDMRYQTIAASDANYSAVTFFPSEDWAKKYKGSKANPGITFDGEYRNGITILMPKDQESNALAEQSKYSDYQFVMEHTGKLELKDYPQAGEVTLEKSGQGYRAFGYINKYDEQGNMYKEPVQQFYPTDLDPGAVYTNWQDQLRYYSDFNKSINQAITQQYGIKDPAKVPPAQ